jgi:hypothetical protein
MPQAGERSVVYPVVQGLRQAARRRSAIANVDGRSAPALEQLPPPRPVQPVE